MAKIICHLEQLRLKKSAKEGRLITQEEIAQACGVYPQVVSRWKNNQIKEREDRVLIKFCLYFDCQIGDLISIDKS